MADQIVKDNKQKAAQESPKQPHSPSKSVAGDKLSQNLGQRSDHPPSFKSGLPIKKSKTRSGMGDPSVSGGETFLNPANVVDMFSGDTSNTMENQKLGSSFSGFNKGLNDSREEEKGKADVAE